MDPVILMLAGGLLVLLPFTAIAVSRCARRLYHLWREFRTTQFIWQNEYHSFEELHSLYDRGDIMLSAVLIASSLQLSHHGMSKAIEAHSTYKSDPWRRLTRTLAFIYIMVRSNKGAERQQVVRWLQNIHRNIPLFEFETNVFVFATFACDGHGKQARSKRLWERGAEYDGGDSELSAKPAPPRQQCTTGETSGEH
ncbi:hypothetical protein AOL_s00140g3 [Orbilia oligospora ATCC 24927]|uniref:ER-bound oxygenase mpaB/mpaB'/Rubber oxygenase catalytic domain-containing protein n=1 Tax=Arthrobotrys oligospora (strain ATCC 24927 / CBS 115.81 / DSM 1491) TaxID=756982 RepID=G1XM34_ARTOA|nr:hypothetical protein AOL_s00140g3 [Orbilia oligospora ATCC 24927]EGX45687.1 hypothetical protein AOL_s00140g3 [Orbilia oligospora ATCC 24927]